ncbi:MAG: undecaprenyldiphospho-muramoylpentapeptide beta-N-acetylglucosaminyltransferase [Rhodospirillaceae bacterium]|nr:undecaprenyldiphospho-muramoylpentapeptide beta-N-acetylglucosaminyltransferase [Rhodospirillaceae bacterium]
MTCAPVMIMAGGTGGHVFPALAVAEELRGRAQPVIWMGTRKGLEARVVPAAGIEMEWISIAGLRGRGAAAWLAAPFRISIAIIQALAAIQRRKPAVVLGMGGFVAGPGGVAAWLCRRPVLIHEQNAVAGTTNRLLSRIARRVFEAFPGSFPGGVAAELVGNPVRRDILDLAHREKAGIERSGDSVHVLILGGSQGARVLNERVPEAMAMLPGRVSVDIWHQAGRGLETAQRCYAERGVEARVDAFVQDMAGAYAWAELVICRAGALTIAELTAAGLGAILVPFPHAVDDHQARNAESLGSRGAGIVIPEHEFTPQRLVDELVALLERPDRIARMGDSARNLARPTALTAIADACLEYAGVSA